MDVLTELTRCLLVAAAITLPLYGAVVRLLVVLDRRERERTKGELP